MTFTARCTISEVSDSDSDVSGTRIYASVNQDDTWETGGSTYPSLNSNTEGVINTAFLSLYMDGPTSMKVGDVIQITGHFTNTAKAGAA